MSIMDKLRGTAAKARQQAGHLADKHGHKIEGGVEKAGQTISRKTKHKYDRHINKGVGMARQGVAKARTKGPSDTPQSPGGPASPGGPSAGGPSAGGPSSTGGGPPTGEASGGPSSPGPRATPPSDPGR